MQIAIDILSAALGGPGQYILDLLPHLSRRAAADHLHVLAAHPELLRRLPFAANVTVHAIRPGRTPVRRLFWQRWRMPAFLRRIGADVVFVAHGLTAMAAGPPLVVLHQDARFFCRRRYGCSRLVLVTQQHLAKRTLARAPRALFVSNAIRDLAESRGWLRPGIASIVPYGVNTEDLLRQADADRLDALRAAPPFVLSVSSLMPHKNVHTLVAAIDTLHRRGRSDIRLIIAGEAPPERPYARQIRAQIESRRLGSAIELVGHLDRPTVAAYYRAARLYVTLSLLEAHPLTPVEAMAGGLPIICNTLPAFYEVCGDAAVCVDGTDAAAVADAVEALWDDEPRRRELAARGRRRAAQFSWPNAADRIYTALRAAAGQP